MSLDIHSLGTGFHELGTAWWKWSHHQAITDDPLWGQPVWWWGRAGKLVQFFGALTIVFDLIGPARLRNLGQFLADLVPLGKLKSMWMRISEVTWQLLVAFLARLGGESITDRLPPPGPDASQADIDRDRIEEDRRRAYYENLPPFPDVRASGLFVPLLLLASAFGVRILVALLWIANWEIGMIMVAFLCGLMVAMISYFTLAPVLVFMVGSIVALAGWLLDLGFEAISESLKPKRFRLLIRAFGLLTLLIGFHFDMLAS